MLDPSTIVEPLLLKASEYKEATKVALTFTASELIAEQLQAGKELKAEFRDVTSQLDDGIADLQAWKRALSVSKAYLSANTSKLEDYFWSVLREEKENTASGVRKPDHRKLPERGRTFLSSCCHEKGGFCVSIGSDEGTWHYECSECKKPCDISPTN